MISIRMGASLRRLARCLALAAASLAALPAHATAAGDVEKALAGLSSWSADFTQSIADGQGKELRSASGKFYLQRPGKFRWDYAEPSQQLVLGEIGRAHV